MGRGAASRQSAVEVVAFTAEGIARGLALPSVLVIDFEKPLLACELSFSTSRLFLSLLTECRTPVALTAGSERRLTASRDRC